MSEGRIGPASKEQEMYRAPEIARAANRAAAARHRAAQRAEYDEYRAEARACGHEVEPFDEWLGEASARERAEQRLPASEDEWHLH